MVGCGKIQILFVALGWILMETVTANNVDVSLIKNSSHPRETSTLKNDGNQIPIQLRAPSCEQFIYRRWWPYEPLPTGTDIISMRIRALDRSYKKCMAPVTNTFNIDFKINMFVMNGKPFR